MSILTMDGAILFGNVRRPIGQVDNSMLDEHSYGALASNNTTAQQRIFIACVPPPMLRLDGAEINNLDAHVSTATRKLGGELKLIAKQTDNHIDGNTALTGLGAQTSQPKFEGLRGERELPKFLVQIVEEVADRAANTV